MIEYGSNAGTFPFTYDEIIHLETIICEKLNQAERDIEHKPHEYVLLNMLAAKIEAYDIMMRKQREIEKQEKEERMFNEG